MNNIYNEISILNSTRVRIVGLLNQFNAGRLNLIVNPYKNNLIWNAAHCLATQNLLTYGLAGIEHTIDDFWVIHFKKGTFPNIFIGDAKIEELKAKLLATPNQLLAHYTRGDFTNFSLYETSFGITLNNIEQAIMFNNTHEGLHFGYMMAIKKFI